MGGSRSVYECVRPCSGAPEAPSMVRLSVSSSSTLTVSFQEPQCFNATVVTKYKGTASLIGSSQSVLFVTSFPQN